MKNEESKLKIKINKITIMLMLLSMLLPILSILMLEHITISETLANMDSGSFGKTYEFISIEQENFVPDKLYQLIDKENTKMAVTSDFELDEINLRSIYFNKRYVNLPMKEGRFFEKKDLKKDNYCAVIGKKLTEESYIKGKERYISILGTEFQVIGIIGYECDAVIDNYIYINGYVQNNLFTSSYYQLDFLEGGKEEEIMENLSKGLQKMNIKMERLTMGSSYFNSLIPRMLYSRWFLVIFFCDILCLILLSFEWVIHQKEEIGIRQLLGATKGSIFLLLGKRYFNIFLVSALTGGIYAIILHPNYKRFLYIGYFVTVPVILVFLIFVTLKILKTPLEEVLK